MSIGQTRVATITVFIAMTCTLGCGPKEGFGVVTGVVTVNGAPAESGQISFFPRGGAGNPVGGKIIDGNYSVETPISEARVEIRVPKVVGEKKLYDTPDSPVKEILAESLPDKFNDESELAVKVEAGKNERNFDLSTTE